MLEDSARLKSGARVSPTGEDPERYGVVEFDRTYKASASRKSPSSPEQLAVTGLFYDPGVVGVARNLKPSARGEYEITDVNRAYLERGQLQVQCMGRGIAWLDTGTYDSLLSSSVFVQTLKNGRPEVACVEEIAFAKQFIDAAQLRKLAEQAARASTGSTCSRAKDAGCSGRLERGGGEKIEDGGLRIEDSVTASVASLHPILN